MDNEIKYCLIHYRENKYFKLCAKVDDKEIAYLNFSLGNPNKQGAWIYEIASNPEFQHRGIASNLMNIMLCYAYDRGYYFIEGKYYPKNHYAKNFYDKCGFEIYKDNYDWFVYKNLYRENMKKVKTQLVDYSFMLGNDEFDSSEESKNYFF